MKYEVEYVFKGSVIVEVSEPWLVRRTLCSIGRDKLFEQSYLEIQSITPSALDRNGLLLRLNQLSLLDEEEEVHSYSDLSF